jgi:hypothetical protein
MPSFLQQTSSFFPPGGVAPAVLAPATGATVTLSKGQSTVFLNTGAIAALTVKMPPSPSAGQVVNLIPNAVITTLTLQTAAGGAIAGAPTTTVAFTEISMRYLNGLWVWVK